MPLLENLQQKPAGFGVDMEARSPEPEPEAFRLFPGLSLEDELRFQTYYTQPERLTELMKEPGMMMAAQFALEPGAGIKANLNRSYVGAMMGIPDGALDDVTYQFVWDGIVQHHFGRTQMSQEEFYNQTAEQFKPFDALVKSGSNPVSEVRARVLRSAAVGTSQVEAGFNGVVASLLRGERNPYMDKTTAQAQADVPILEGRIAQARAQMRELNKQHRRGFVPPQGSDMARLPDLERQLGFAQLAAEGRIEENFLGSWSRTSEDLAGAHRERAQERQGWFSDEIVAAHDSWWVMRVADSVGQSAPGMVTSMMNPAFGLSLMYAQNFENASAEFEGKMREEGRSYTAEERENYAHTQSLYQTPWELVGDVAVGKAVKAIFKSIPAGTITKGPNAFGDWLGPQLKKIGESAAGEVLITTPGQTVGEAMIAEDAGVRERTTPWEKAGQTFDAMSVALGQVGGMGGGSMLVSGGVKAVKGDFDIRYGDAGEAILQATMRRQAVNLVEANRAAEVLVGKALANRATGIEAYISKNSLSKMLSDSAVRKSNSLVVHAKAVANIDQLFTNAEVLESGPDRNNDKNIRAIHRFYSPMIHDGEVLAAKITVKESANPGNSNRIYTVEAIDIEKVKLAGQLAPTPANDLGRVAPITSFTDRMLWLGRKVKAKWNSGMEKKDTFDPQAPVEISKVSKVSESEIRPDVSESSGPDAYSVENTLEFAEYEGGETPPYDEQAVEQLRQALGSKGEGLRAVRPVASKLVLQPGAEGQVAETRRKFEGSEEHRFIEAYQKAFGKKVVFLRGDALLPDGMSLRGVRNTVFIDAKAVQGLDYLLGHELVHAIKDQNTVVYRRLIDELLPMARDTAAYKRRLQEIAPGEYVDSVLDEEVLGDFVGSQFANQEFWKKLETADRTTFQKVAAAAKAVLDKIVQELRKLPRTAEPYFLDRLEEAQTFLAERLKEYAAGPMPNRYLPESANADLSVGGQNKP